MSLHPTNTTKVITRSSPLLGRANKIKNPARKGRYTSARAEAEAVLTKFAVPRGRRSTSRQGNAIAVATASPDIPPNQVDAHKPTAAVVRDQSGI